MGFGQNVLNALDFALFVLQLDPDKLFLLWFKVSIYGVILFPQVAERGNAGGFDRRGWHSVRLSTLRNGGAKPPCQEERGGFTLVFARSRLLV